MEAHWGLVSIGQQEERERGLEAIITWRDKVVEPPSPMLQYYP